MEIGELIKIVRQEEGITQEELANRIVKTKSYVSKIEKQSFMPNSKVVKNIALALNIQEECFKGGSVTGLSAAKALLATYVENSCQERYELIKEVCANIINFEFKDLYIGDIINNNDLLKDIESLIKNRIEFYSNK